MTEARTYAATGGQRAGTLSLFGLEALKTTRLALPMALTQLGQVAMFTTDVGLLGRLGGEAIAAVALAHTVFFGAFVLGLGIVSGVSPLAAQSYGAREPRQVRRVVRAGLWAAAAIGIASTIGLQRGGDILAALGQKPDASYNAGLYLIGLAFSLVPTFIFIALRNFMGSVNRPEPALWITLAAIPLNGCLAYVLIFGALGFPKLGLLGAGIGTTIVSICMCAAAILVCYAMHPFRKYRILGRFWRFDPPLLWKLIRIGAPISGQFIMEFGVFAAAALLMGKIGTVELAAHQIALQVASILFMVPIGISMAATVRVGHAAGQHDRLSARRAGIVAIGLGAAFMASMTAIVAAIRPLIPALFIGADTILAAETMALASKLLLFGLFFFIADGVQGVASGALRGLNDTRVPFAFAFFSFWVAGFTLSYVLAFSAGQGAEGIWAGLTLGLILYASLLVSRFLILTNAGKGSSELFSNSAAARRSA